MDRFYIGLHQPSDAQHFERCCIHIGRLLTRQKLLGCDELLLDSQAFRVLELHGDHVLSVAEYAAAVLRIRPLVHKLIVVPQDYMCESYIFQKRYEHAGIRFTVADHQRLTIARYDELRGRLPRSIPVLPVLQGYHPLEYVSHIRQYGRRIGFGKNAWVGVGSVCKRNADPSSIRDVLYAIKRERPDLRLHGFGVKSSSLSSLFIRDNFFSADSMAWSYAARMAGGDANDWHAARSFDRRIQGHLDDLPMFTPTPPATYPDR